MPQATRPSHGASSDATPDADMQPLLRGVSRSFYLSIRLLPAQLRRPISVAYLLARATDTLADTASLPVDDRRGMLETLGAAIDGSDEARRAVAGLSKSFAPLQQDAREQALILALPRCLAWQDELAPADHNDIRAVLRHITRGQSLDIARFGDGTMPQALATAAQLDEYTYLVAGCVGEFWTELCFRHVPAFANLAKQPMRELGRQYGMGLQLVNILRDAARDLAMGRCYFPADELAAQGLQPHDIAAHPERFAIISNRWQALAQSRLEFGMQYAHAVASRRVRAASAMPALIGARTLALLRAAGPLSFSQTVKVPRHEVRSMMARLAFTLAGRSSLQAMFGRCAAGA